MTERTSALRHKVTEHSASARSTARARGNGNAGHEFGTTLSPSDKDALIEWLKML
jgi:hypothetical protein